MSMKKALLSTAMLALAADAMAAPLNYEGNKKGNGHHSKPPLNNRQKKARAAAKAAKKARKKNRR